MNLKSDIECFILIEPGLGYIIPVLREKFKESKIIVLHADESFVSEEAHSNTAVLHSAETEKVQDFLEKEVPDVDASLIRIIEWRPSLNYYKEAYIKLFSHAVEFIKRTDAEKRTTAAFGKRWFKNFFRNLGIVEKTVLYKDSSVPVIITGSGPSLETALPVIKKKQDSCLILAASSSVMALANAGIWADLVIATDGGQWALKHIYPFYRNASPSSAGSCAASAGSCTASALAVNLCAALPSQCIDTPSLILNDGSFWQSIVLHELSLPSIIIAQKGTVTASAVELALVLSRGNIYLAGMDLSVNDIRTHVRPYGFDYLLFNGANRFSPVYSQSFIRSDMLHHGGSMNIYAAWFKNQLALWPKRIFSVTGSEIFEKAHISSQDITDKKNYFKTVHAGGNASFGKRGKDALLKAMKKNEYAENLKAELAPLLFPGKKDVSQKELEEAINGVYCG